MKKACCFIGHIDIYEQEYLMSKIKEVVIDLLLKDYHTFIFDYDMGFCNMCRKVVANLKAKYPDKIDMACYFCRYDNNMRPEEKPKWKKLLYVNGGFFGQYKKMIEDSDVCVFYNLRNFYRLTDKTESKIIESENALNKAHVYAEEKGKKIFDLR